MSILLTLFICEGVWTNGPWVFSTGLDQRLRCWCVGEQGKLTEFDNVIVSVPEPEALDARVCSRFVNRSFICQISLCSERKIYIINLCKMSTKSCI